MLNTCAQLFIDELNAKDLNFQTGIDNDGDSVVEFPYQGKVAKLFFSGDEGKYLSMYLVYEQIPKKKVAELIFTCNQLNAQYKWVTFYVDSDNDLVFHNDAILTPATAADHAFELLVRMLKIGDEEKSTIMKAIYA